MKKQYAVAFLFLPFLVFPQEKTFTLNGTVGHLNKPAVVYLTYQLNGERITDSAFMQNGVFQFKGVLNDTVPADILLYPKGNRKNTKFPHDFLSIYLEPQQIEVSGSKFIKDAAVSGSQINTDLMRYNEMMKPVNETMKELEKVMQNAQVQNPQSGMQVSTEFRTKCLKIYNDLMATEKQLSLLYIEENPRSLVSLDIALRTYGCYIPDITIVEPLFNSLSKEVRNSSAGKLYVRNLEKWKLVGNGAVAPDFTQNDPEGRPVKLSDFRGKYVLLDFWASWCGPCRKENPSLVNVYTQNKDKNFTILGISLDQKGGRDSWLKAIKDDQLTWTHVSDLNYLNNEVAVLYGVQAIPDYFLIGPDGKIIGRGLRGADLETKLQELLKK